MTLLCMVSLSLAFVAVLSGRKKTRMMGAASVLILFTAREADNAPRHKTASEIHAAAAIEFITKASKER